MKKILILLIVGLLILSYAPIFTAQWTSDPLENTAITTMSGEQALPKIAIDSNGYSYISWFSNDAGNYDVRLQRLDNNGNTIWPENGIIVSNEPQETWLTDYDLSVGPSGYAVVTFTDIRTGQSNPVGYRISPNGDMMWGQNGIMLANDNNFDPSPKVCVTTSGNSIFAWQSIPDSGNSEIRLQKISADGQLLWDDGIVLSQSGIDFTSPYLLQAEGDYAYLIWHKQTGPYYAPNRGLYVQKLDVDGSFMWTSDVVIYAPVVSGPVVNLNMCRDDSGGIIFSWYRAYDGSHFHCYVQQMDADGTIGMTANGVIASTSTARNHMYPAVAFLDQTQEIIIFFSEQDLDQNMRGMYAQKLDLQGNRLWGNEGIQLIGLSYNDYFLFSANSKDNNAICIYQAAEFGNYIDTKIQAVMLDDEGNFVWLEHFVDLCTYQSQKLHNVMTNYYMGQWVAVWQDLRNDYGDIYAQNIQPNGTLGVVVYNPPIADLDCEGSLSWEEVNAGSNVTGSFKVKNIGEEGSLLNWSIDSYPSWGTWTFTPDNGTELPDGGSVTVAVSVVAPSEKNSEYSGKVKIVNSDNATDFCEIDVVLTTPRTRTINGFFILHWILQKYLNKFPVIQHLLVFFSIK